MAQEYYPWSANTTSQLDRTYSLEVAANNVEGASLWLSNGSNQAVGTSFETLWEEGGIYTYPSSASTMTVSSDDANDTSAGTGARTVLISGLDTNYLEIQETVTLNGTSGVTTTNEFLRINGIRVATAGSGETNAGSIFVGTGTVTAGKPANVFSEVYIGDGIAHEGFYTVPANKALHILEIEFGAESGKSIQMRIVTRTSAGVQTVEVEFEISNTFSLDTLGILKFEEKTDIQIQVKVSSGSTDAKVLGLGVLRNET
jgi:hypothetical protein